MAMKCRTIFKGSIVFLWVLAGVIAVLQGALQYTSIAGVSRLQVQSTGKKRAGATVSNAYAKAAEPGSNGKYSKGYVGAKTYDYYSAGVGRGALLGGALAAALAASMNVLASLPIVGVALVAATSIGLIGRDVLTYRRAGNMSEIMNTPKMVLGFLFVLLGGNLILGGSPTLVAIAAGAAAIGFAAKSQTQQRWTSPASLPSKSTLPKTVSAKRTNIVWSTWSRVSGYDWQPGRPGLNNWQRDQWHTRPQLQR